MALTSAVAAPPATAGTNQRWSARAALVALLLLIVLLAGLVPLWIDGSAGPESHGQHAVRHAAQH